MNTANPLSPTNPLVARCWADEAFKKRLLADPLATLQAEGFNPPPGLSIRFFENTPSVLNIVLPVQPTPAQGDLTDQQLQAVAGGGKFLQDLTEWFERWFLKPSEPSKPY
jgi:hypothetical protein